MIFNCGRWGGAWPRGRQAPPQEGSQALSRARRGRRRVHRNHPGTTPRKGNRYPNEISAQQERDRAGAGAPKAGGPGGRRAGRTSRRERAPGRRCARAAGRGARAAGKRHANRRRKRGRRPRDRAAPERESATQGMEGPRRPGELEDSGGGLGFGTGRPVLHRTAPAEPHAAATEPSFVNGSTNRRSCALPSRSTHHIRIGQSG